MTYDYMLAQRCVNKYAVTIKSKKLEKELTQFELDCANCSGLSDCGKDCYIPLCELSEEDRELTYREHLNTS